MTIQCSELLKRKFQFFFSTFLLSLESDYPSYLVYSVRIFSIPLAKALLLMSALVYERKDEFVVLASELTAQAQRIQNDTEHRDRLLKEAEAQLDKSEEVIKQQVCFRSLSFSPTLVETSLGTHTLLSPLSIVIRLRVGDSTTKEFPSWVLLEEDLSLVFFTLRLRLTNSLSSFSFSKVSNDHYRTISFQLD